MLTETLFTFLLCLGIFLLALGIKKQNSWLLLGAGIALGYGALVRPALLLFPVITACILLLDLRSPIKKRIINATLVFATVALIWSPWAIWKSDKEATSNNAASSFALGGYPDLIYKSPKLRGFPYKEDEEYKEMAKDMGHGFSVISERFQNAPGKYIYWYLIGKPITYWSWSIIAGTGGPFVYKILNNIYLSNELLKYTLVLYQAIHPISVLLALVGLLLLARSIHKSGYNIEHSTTILLIVSCMIYFTAIHMVFAPLPRYSVPLHPLLYLAGLYTITRWIEYKCNKSGTDAD